MSVAGAAIGTAAHCPAWHHSVVELGGRMTIQERSVDTVTVLDLSGRLVLGDGAEHLKQTAEALTARGCRHIILNLTDVSYVDSAGLGALLAVFFETKKHGGAVKLQQPSKRLHDLLAMARLTTVFDITESERDALAGFGVNA
jgi:anti-sigma B factor antagonist